MTQAGIELLRPARKGEPTRSSNGPLRQVIESIFDTLKGQLDLEHHGDRTCGGVIVPHRSTRPMLPARLRPRPHRESII